MSHRNLGSLVALILLSMLGGCTKDEMEVGWLVVEIDPRPGLCVIQGTEIRCDDAPRYLRDTLHTSISADVLIKCDKKCPNPSRMGSLMGALKAAGFIKVMGLVPHDA